MHDEVFESAWKQFELAQRLHGGSEIKEFEKQKAKDMFLAWRDKAVVAARLDEIDRIAIATDNGDLRDGVRAATYLTERGDYLNQLNKATIVGIDYAYPDKDGAKDE